MLDECFLFNYPDVSEGDGFPLYIIVGGGKLPDTNMVAFFDGVALTSFVDDGWWWLFGLCCFYFFLLVFGFFFCGYYYHALDEPGMEQP